MRKIAEHIAGACRAGEPLVLVAVAESKESTPRKAGTLMLVSADGLVCGTIGGGALEAHGIACARRLLGGKAHRFESMGLEERLGMVCGGSASLLYVPICGGSAAWAKVASELLRCFDQRTPAYLALSCCDELPQSGEGVALLDADGALLAGDGSAPGDRVRGQKGRCIADGWLMLPVPLPVRAVVFGGGHVGSATVSALSRVGFSCTLFDCRPEFANAGKSHGAQQVVVGDYSDIAASLTLDERDYVLIMTHSHRHDFAVLEQVLRRAGATVLDAQAPERARPGLTKADLMAAGLTGGADSARRRQALLKELELPEHTSANALLQVLNGCYSREEALDLLGLKDFDEM